MFGDLHFHSTNSDGIVTPEGRIEEMKTLDPERAGLWALTDHDRFSPEFVMRAREAGFDTLYGTEISAQSESLGISLHVTCYTPEFSLHFARLVEGIVIGRKKKIVGQIEQLADRGFQINIEDFSRWIELQGMSPDMASNWHIASYLWRDEASSKVSLALAESLTHGLVTDQISFMKECLRATGDYREVGYHLTAPYEPSLSTLSTMAEGEGALLSIAHPNFAFGKTLKRLGAKAREDRYPIFRDVIAPMISEEGVRNFEINALASPPWIEAIERVSARTKGLITYGSDNHGLTTPDDKHGLIGRQNPLLTVEMVVKVRRRFEEMVEG